MPCYDPEAERYAAREDRDRLEKQCHQLSRLLCEAMGYLDTRNIGDGSKELRAWWAKHKAWDKKRGAR